MRDLAEEELRELLQKNWMTHDGMWFFHCLRECGIETTNRLNRAAVRSMADFEVRRCLTALEMEPPRTMDGIREFVTRVFGLVKADFMDFQIDFPEDGKLAFRMGRCFAHDGVKRMGVLEQYECGIYERIEAWFRGLGLDFEVTPPVIPCPKLQGRECRRVYTLSFAG